MPADLSTSASSPPAANRFRTSPLTLFVDRAMTWIIKAGGIAIIIAVFGIFAFIFIQILPLFRGAAVDESGNLPLPIPAAQVAAVALDEWGRVPTVIGRDGRIHFLDDKTGNALVVAPELGERRITAQRYDARHNRLILGCDDGSLVVTQLSWEMAFTKAVTEKSTSRHAVAAGTNDGSTVTGSASRAADLPLAPGRAVLAVAFADADKVKLAAVVVDAGGGKRQVLAVPLSMKGGMIGGKKLVADEPIDFSAQIRGTPDRVLVDERCEGVVVGTAEGELFYFHRGNEDAFTLRQPPFTPFKDQTNQRIASCDWLLGDVSLVLTSTTGVNRQYSLFHAPGGSTRQFGLTKEFPTLPSGASSYAVSTRNKCFLVASEKTLSIRHGTSATERFADDMPFTPMAVALSGKYHRIAAAGDDGKLHLLTLDDPHPESGVKALFGTVWYEGKGAPAYEWQSTGASDDFEPKLSLVPLLWGTLKATFYAMIFAVPLALLGAIYTAEFMHPRFKKIVKPTVEIMASLPSVVLGFLAALWLAPRLEERVPSVLLVFILLPTVAMLVGWWWSGLDMRWRSKVKPGYEYLAFMPVLLATAIAAWSLGPWFENLVFNGDFRTWWTATTGLSFEQRNSLVVGIIMGFAVIPIIFTISEDALTNVPPALRSGSLALGASRWQTALHIVLPTASAGIFSALMIGLGRAIGETMIVVMATGNTPIMTGNIFDGLRTLSANIAVELPEAAQHGTLYRTLFLGAFLLFVLTFVVNTAAELLRQHLREKYKTV